MLDKGSSFSSASPDCYFLPAFFANSENFSCNLAVLFVVIVSKSNLFFKISLFLVLALLIRLQFHRRNSPQAI